MKHRKNFLPYQTGYMDFMPKNGSRGVVIEDIEFIHSKLLVLP